MKSRLIKCIITLLILEHSYGFQVRIPGLILRRILVADEVISVFMNRPTGGVKRTAGKRFQPRQQEQTARPPMNDEVTAKTLRVITPSPNGKDVALGVMSREEAMAKAIELGNLDLILINENSDPPVCKLVDYSKYKYSIEKKAKEVKKNSKASELKEIKMSYKIDIHDYDVRKKSAIKFIRQGNRVKCTVMFRGREMQHDKLGFELLEKLANELDSLCIQEGRPKREGRNLSLMLTPKPEVLRAVNEARKKAKKLKAIKGDENSVDGEDQEDDEDDEDDFDDDYEEDEEVVNSGKREKTLEEILGTSDYL